MQPGNPRPSDSAGRPAGSDDADDAFESGHGPRDEASDQGVEGELPSWLRNFAEVAGDQPGDAERPASAGSGSQSIPGWVEAPAKPAPRGPARPGTRSGTQPAPDPRALTRPNRLAGSGEASFFSDDDLPDWLRALNTEDLSGDRGDPAPVAAADGAAHVSVAAPAVSRAWVALNDPVEPSPGAGVFAALVHELDTRPDLAGGSASESEPVSSGKPQGQAPAVAQAQFEAPTSPKEKRRWGRFRLWGVTFVIVAAVLVLFVMNPLS